MIGYIKFNGVLHYITGTIYALAVFGSLIGSFNDGSLLILVIVFGLLAWLFIALGNGMFRVARKAENYTRFCNAQGIDVDKEHSEKFFSQYKMEVK